MEADSAVPETVAAAEVAGEADNGVTVETVEEEVPPVASADVAVSEIPEASAYPEGMDPTAVAVAEGDDDDDDEDEDGPPRKKRGGHGRRKIEIEYIEDKIRRHITFSKRKAGISKKAYELSRLTGAQVLLLISSERGQIYSFATPKLQPILVNENSKQLIEQCLNAPDPMALNGPGMPMMPPEPQMPPPQPPPMPQGAGGPAVPNYGQQVAYPGSQEAAMAANLVALQPGAMLSSQGFAGHPALAGHPNIPAGSYIVAPDGQVQGMIPHPQQPQ